MTHPMTHQVPKLSEEQWAVVGRVLSDVQAKKAKESADEAEDNFEDLAGLF